MPAPDADETGIAPFERLAAELRAAPGAFRNVSALARAAQLHRDGLNALIRVHAHRTPAAWLKHERTLVACRALHATSAPVSSVAAEAGFASSDAFERACLAQMHMPPAAYRALGRRHTFALVLPPRYRAAGILAYHNRDPNSLCECVRGQRIFKALLIPGGAAVLELALETRRVVGRVHAATNTTIGPEGMRFAHNAALRMLGLNADMTGFHAHARRHPTLAALVARRRGLRLPLSATPFDGLCWAIVGQQINLAFASALRHDFIELAGLRVNGMRAHPTAEQTAALDVSELRQRRFSRSKAQYLIGAAQAVASGELAVDTLADGSALGGERRLTAVRGIGTWTARYMLMRGCGFADCAPVGDVALAAALKNFSAAEQRPSHDEVEILMQPFSPFRSLATMHLWASLKTAS